MVKDHSDSEKGNPLPPHRLLYLMKDSNTLLMVYIVRHMVKDHLDNKKGNLLLFNKTRQYIKFR